MLESHQIDSAGTSFFDFLNQCEKVMKSSFLGFVFSNIRAKARKSLNRVSWDSFCLSIHDTGTILHQETFCYRIIVHWVTCSWVPCLLTEPAGDPRKKKCLRKSLSIIICPPPLSHYTLSFTCKVGTPRSVMS